MEPGRVKAARMAAVIAATLLAAACAAEQSTIRTCILCLTTDVDVHDIDTPEQAVIEALQQQDEDKDR